MADSDGNLSDAKRTEAAEERIRVLEEALRRLAKWGGLGQNYSFSISNPIARWIEEGMTGKLPPLPEWWPSPDTPRDPHTKSDEAARCGRCGGDMKLGKVLISTMEPTPAFADSPAVTHRLVDCIKCEKCGHPIHRSAQSEPSNGVDGKNSAHP